MNFRILKTHLGKCGNLFRFRPVGARRTRSNRVSHTYMHSVYLAMLPIFLDRRCIWIILTKDYDSIAWKGKQTQQSKIAVSSRNDHKHKLTSASRLFPSSIPSPRNFCCYVYQTVLFVGICLCRQYQCSNLLSYYCNSGLDWDC